MKEWKIIYVTDYPFTNTMTVEAVDEMGARREFEKQTGYEFSEFCVIKEI